MRIRQLLLIVALAVLTVGTSSTAEANTQLKVTNFVRLMIPDGTSLGKAKLVDKDEAFAEVVTNIIVADEEECDDDEYTDGEEVNRIEEFYELFPAQFTTTVILDTERDADGSPLRRHVYCYDGFEDSLTDDGCKVQGSSKMVHLSFAADEAGLAQWRQELMRLFASKNRTFLSIRNAKLKALDKKFSKVKNKDENEKYRSAYYEMEDNLVRNREIERAFVLLKPMGGVEYGDVIDAWSILDECQVHRYQLEKVSHTDSVMAFNSLYPATAMPKDVDFYSFDNRIELQERFALDVPEGFDMVKPETFIKEYYRDPLLAVKVKPGKNHAEGASVVVVFNDEMFKEMARERMEEAEEYELQVVDEPEENIDYDMLLNRLVEEYGINSKKEKRIEVGSDDSELNDLIEEFKKVAYHYLHEGWVDIWLHADRHIPYAIVNCVIDCFKDHKLTHAY